MAEIFAILVVVFGIVAAIVSVITEFIKNAKYIKEIPTMWVVVTLSVLIWIYIYMTACSIGWIESEWYIAVASIIIGVLDACLASMGWEKFYLRFKEFVRCKKYGKKIN